MKALHLKITGHVQGVFFRTETKERADQLGLTGWVRNCEDGSVEVFAQGEDNSLKKFEGWCHEGPPMAQVYDILIEEAQKEPFDTFDIRF